MCRHILPAVLDNGRNPDKTMSYYAGNSMPDDGLAQRDVRTTAGLVISTRVYTVPVLEAFGRIIRHELFVLLSQTNTNQ